MNAENSFSKKWHGVAKEYFDYLLYIYKSSSFEINFQLKNLAGLEPPLMLYEYEEVVDFETMFSGSPKCIELKRKVFGTTGSQAILKKYIPYFDEHEVFD